MNTVFYQICPIDLAGHRFDVAVTIKNPNPSGQLVSLPAWIPGSYLIRDFSKNIETIAASSQGKPLSINKTDSHHWLIEPCATTIELHYRVYAWDLSVRTAHIDETHAFFNGTSTFLQVHGKEDETCLVEIKTTSQTKDWKVYTSLPRATHNGKKTPAHSFGFYQAPNYDALIDHPVEMGKPHYISFTACGVLHEMVLTGNIPNVDLERIAQDTKRICEYQIKLFEPQTHQAPFADSSDRYVFMTMVTGNTYGGLEHRASTALMASRADLPVQNNDNVPDDYIKFLGLVSHEYFHSWNVKRIKPQAFAPYQLYSESNTQLLWIFEGFTSYYDDLILLRSGIIDQKQYFKLITTIINSVNNTPGRHKQTVAQSSYDAWTKYYKQDENSLNAIVSYYTKGSLVALCLDLYLRKNSQGKYSLDDVMRALWVEYGRDFYPNNNYGLGEDDFSDLVKKATSIDISDFLNRYVDGLEELPLADLLKAQNVLLNTKEKTQQASLDIRVTDDNTQVKIATVTEHGAAHQAGLSAGDIIIAIDHIRANTANYKKLLASYQAGQNVTIHVFRRDELRSFNVRFSNGADNVYELSPIN